MEQAIAQATAEWARHQVQAEVFRPRVATRPATATPQAAPGLPGRKLPPPPSWWKGDQDASRSNLIAAQQLRRGK